MIQNLLIGMRRALARGVGYSRLRAALERIEARCESIEARTDERDQLRTALAEAQGRLTDSEAARTWLESEAHKWVAAGVRNAVLQANPEALFRVDLNGALVDLPQHTIRTMAHCLVSQQSGRLKLGVEAAHCEWMGERLRPGGTFLDVGAATGATTLPIARRHGGKVRVIAFEPSATANRVLRATLAANGYENVEVVAAAVSDACGTAEFSEYGHDETGAAPFLPEASALTSPGIDRDRASRYEVPVTTLDKFFADRPAAERVDVMKIDVEGFEVAVIDGGRGFLTRTRPAIAIDIHKHPFQDGNTERPVRERLDRLGYRFQKVGHVLLCIPS